MPTTSIFILVEDTIEYSRVELLYSIDFEYSIEESLNCSEYAYSIVEVDTIATLELQCKCMKELAKVFELCLLLVLSMV